MPQAKALIDHVVFVVDESASMYRNARQVVQVFDQQVDYLARRSKERDRETRVSVYTFGSTAPDPIYYDKDVLRLPSISRDYNPSGRTALIDATIKSLDDLGQTAQLYGDHAFLVFVLTDGEENNSRNTAIDMKRKLAGLPAEWTVAVLVPNMRGKHEAQGFGFSPDNIAIWDPEAHEGVEGAGQVIQRSTEEWMNNRSRGVRGTKTLFSTGADAVNRQTVRSSLKPLSPRTYDILPVDRRMTTRDYIEQRGHVKYVTGNAYYQFTKKETIQGGKRVLIREKSTGDVYGGDEARELLGLDRTGIREKPDYNPDYDIFVQSTSPVRVLVPGTDVIVLR